MSEQNTEPTGFPRLPEEELPPPRPKARGRDGLRLAVGLAVAAGLAFWLSGTITQQRKAETPPAANATAENATGQAAPGLALPPGQGPGMQAAVTPPPGDAPEAFAEDPVVPSSFFRAVARWAVAQYQPPQSRHNGGDRPLSQLSVSRLNARFGTEDDAFGPGRGSGPELRRRVLAYVFQPGFVGYLGRNSMTPFLGFLREAAAEARRDYRTARGFSSEALRPADAAAMYRLYAALAADTGKVLGATAAHREITARVKAAQAASAMVAQAYEKTWDGGGGQPLSGAEADAVIRQAVAERAAARAAAIRAVRERAGKIGLDDDETFYVAEWAVRRAATPGQLDGLAAAAELLADLSLRLENLARESEAPPSPAPEPAPETPAPPAAQ